MEDNKIKNIAKEYIDKHEAYLALKHRAETYMLPATKEAYEKAAMSECVEKEEVLKQIDCWLMTGEYKYSNATHYLNKRILSIKPKSDWISVKDRLPDDKKQYLICTESREIYIAYYQPIGDKFSDYEPFWQGDSCRFTTCVTHWQPLPKRPKEDKE